MSTSHLHDDSPDHPETVTLVDEKKVPSLAADLNKENLGDAQTADDSKDSSFPSSDVRVAIVGNVDSGKSTLIGVLTNGELDNGRGLARSRIFVHRHEAENGRTSCISQHIVGFDGDRKIVHQHVPASATAAQKNKSWREVVSKSRSLLTLVDLAGHEKYLKTTIAGLTGCHPDYAIVVVGSNMGVTKMTKEHLGVCIALQIPIIIVVTKIDMCPDNVLDNTKQKLYKILKSQGARKKPFDVRSEKDVETCIKTGGPMLCPVFYVSTVTGENINLLTQYLSLLQPRVRDAADTKEVEFDIDETFNVTGVGLVVSGTISRGVMECNTTVLLGPFGTEGSFKEVLIRSIHAKRTPVASCRSGTGCAVALKAVNRRDPLKRSDIRRGMVLVDANSNPRAVWRFQAEVIVLHHPTTIKAHYQAVIHCGMVRQTAVLETMQHECMRTGDKSICIFKFMRRPEYLREGETFLFREGSTKGVGRVLKLIHDMSPSITASPSNAAAVPPVAPSTPVSASTPVSVAPS